MRSALASIGFAVLLGSAAPAQEKLRVVTTLHVLRDIVAEVGGSHVVVEALASPRGNPHLVRAKPTLKRRVRRADAFVEIGLGLELWADQLVRSSGNSKVRRGGRGRIVATEGVHVLEVDPSATRAQGHVHTAGNPHVWLDPVRVRQMAANIAAGLTRLAPANRASFERNLRGFQKRLDIALFGAAPVERLGGDKLQGALKRGKLQELLASEAARQEKQGGQAVKLGGWLARAAPLGGRAFVSYHKTFSYFCDRFGTRVPITVEKYPGIVPSARHRDVVIKTVRDQNVVAVVSASYYSARAAEYIAEKSGVPHLRLPVDVGALPHVKNYFDLIDWLLDELGKTVGK